METTILFAALAALILLAVTSLRFGVDSRDGFRSAEHEMARRGFVWDRALTARHHTGHNAHRRRQEECLPLACN